LVPWACIQGKGEKNLKGRPEQSNLTLDGRTIKSIVWGDQKLIRSASMAARQAWRPNPKECKMDDLWVTYGRRVEKSQSYSRKGDIKKKKRESPTNRAGPGIHRKRIIGRN